MITSILNILKENQNIHAFNVKVVTKDVYQLYFIKQKLEMNREVVTEDYCVTIFCKQQVKGKDKIGKVSFNIYPSMSKDEIIAKVEEQISLCGYVLNDEYTLPKKMTLKAITKDVAFGNDLSLKEAAFLAADALFEADKFDKGYLNSSEIFIVSEDTKFYDSNGNTFQFMNLYGQIELVATWCEKNEETEAYKFFEFDNLDLKFIQKQANDVILEASNRHKAKQTPLVSNCKVLLTKKYAEMYFRHFVDKLNNANVYNHNSEYQPNQRIQEANGRNDLISIRLEPIMIGSSKGRTFDDEGIVLKRLHVFEKGVVKSFWGGNSYSQYLNRPVNGTYENMVVNAGSLQKDDLEEENYLEIISLSDFDIDLVTGEFGSEIRLAYLYLKNKEKQVVTGGSISGNIYKSLDSIRFSNDTIQINNYIGPEKVLLEKVNINQGKQNI